VVNARQEMLVVQEANGPLRGQDFWKMPTGLVHEGEDLIEAAEREVLEETGVRYLHSMHHLLLAYTGYYTHLLKVTIACTSQHTWRWD
jgi:ADP-ribose pyrophosphatase YjhB (NUDIX family)